MIKKTFIMLLIVSLLNVYLPRVTFSQVGDIKEEITKHAPEMRSTPEENIPVEVVKKRGPIWPWVVLGLLVVGGTLALVMAGGGGGGGGNSSTSSSSGGNSGSVAVGW
jgi:hypothetical protein